MSEGVQEADLPFTHRPRIGDSLPKMGTYSDIAQGTDDFSLSTGDSRKSRRGPRVFWKPDRIVPQHFFRPRSARIKVAGFLLYSGGMYISSSLVMAWAVLTVGTLAFAVFSRMAHKRSRAYLRQAKKTVQRLEQKNGKLWYEVMKTRAGSELHRLNEVTVTKVTNAG